MPMTTSDLVRLLDLTASGDRKAFEGLYQATSAKLYGIVLRILVRRELAEEVLQDVYLKVWQRAGDFDASRSSPITWMATIARNRALDEVRRGIARPTADASEAAEVADPQMLASDRVELSDDFRRLERCLSGLEADKRSMVLLAYLDGWSREQLAKRFGHPISTVKTWLHRSLKQIKDCLAA